MKIFIILLGLFSLFSSADDFAQNRLKDQLEIQTIHIYSLMYRDLKRNILAELDEQEKSTNRKSSDWSISEWNKFVDKLIEEKVILAEELQLSKEKNKSIRKSIATGIKKSIKDLKNNAKENGAGTPIVLISSTALGYTSSIIAFSIGAHGLGAFLTIFPIGTVVTASYIAIVNIFKNAKMKKFFNEGEDFNYYKEYKSIHNKVSKGFDVKKQDLLLLVDQSKALRVRKNDFSLNALQMLGIMRSKLTIKTLLRFLKRNSLYDSQAKRVRKSKELSMEEKIIILTRKVYQQDSKLITKFEKRFNKNFIHNVYLDEQVNDISNWAFQIYDLKDLSEIPTWVDQAPQSAPALSITNLLAYFSIPRIVRNIEGVRRKQIKCLKVENLRLQVQSFKQAQSDWAKISEHKNKYFSGIEACLN